MSRFHAIYPEDVSDANVIQASRLRGATAVERAIIRRIGSILCLFLRKFALAFGFAFFAVMSSAEAITPTEVAKLLASDGAPDDRFAFSVAIDGDTAVIGAYRDDDNGSDSGSAYIYTNSGGVWTQEAKLLPTDGQAGVTFGWAVALDGDTAVIGAYQDDDNGSNSGSAYVFTRSGAVWNQEAKLLASDGSIGDWFGYSVSIDGNTAIIGAQLDSVSGFSQSGSAYVFTRNGVLWSEQAKLTPSDPDPSDSFGVSVAVHGDTALIGAYRSDDDGSESGSAYVFVRTGTTWAEEAKLLRNVTGTVGVGDWFGWSVDIFGNTAVIGCRDCDDNGVNSGSAYVFERSSGVWAEQSLLLPADGVADDRFGLSVAIDGAIIVVGSHGDDDNGVDSGSAYVFSQSAGVWSEETKLLASDGAAGDRFGRSIGIDNLSVVVGAWVANSSVGSAYVYSLAPSTASVMIDPVAYDYQWVVRELPGGTEIYRDTGDGTPPTPATLDLEPGTYQVSFGGDDVFTFGVASDGTVTSNNIVAASGGIGQLTFNNVEVDIFTGNFIGTRRIRGRIGPVQRGDQMDVVLVPGLRWGISAANVDFFLFDIAADTTVSVVNGISATGGLGTLTYNTVEIFSDVNEATFPGTWFVHFVNDAPPATGDDSVHLVPSLSYQFVGRDPLIPASESQIISVTDPCAVTPNTFTLLASEFNLSCGPPDADGDDVPDGIDNCPVDFNPDQIDQDLDGIGNVCDPDLDGDGFNNDVDNCPNIWNEGQENIDGDAFGDACDGDIDDDSVPNDLDNCPLDANTDQGDNDGDNEGDVCDSDDDNDTVLDDDDNCPLTANLDQTDTDGDGQGDVCDGDVDGDGVANETDVCPLSPAGQPVNADGCTGPQLIARQCVCEDYVQHGQYVSCVAHTGNDAVAQGLMAPNEKARFVKEAAKNKCN